MRWLSGAQPAQCNCSMLISPSAKAKLPPQFGRNVAGKSTLVKSLRLAQTKLWQHRVATAPVAGALRM